MESCRYWQQRHIAYSRSHWKDPVQSIHSIAAKSSESIGYHDCHHTSSVLPRKQCPAQNCTSNTDPDQIAVANLRKTSKDPETPSHLPIGS